MERLLCPWVEEIARHDGILDVYEDLIGPNILCYSMAFRIKDFDDKRGFRRFILFVRHKCKQM